MKTVRFVATILFYLTRILASLYLISFVYSAVVLFLSFQSDVTWNPIVMTADNGFEILYPFTDAPFLLGEYTKLFILEMLLGIGLYGVFLWLLSDVFLAFRQPKLFTSDSVKKLSRFYIVNLTIPGIVFLILSLFSDFSEERSDMVMLTVLHFIIGIFIFFMASIFKQGVELQNEQDLYI